MGTHSPVQE